MDANNKLCLGLDLGTTSVKISLLDMTSQTSIFSTSEATNATVQSDVGPRGSEQNVQTILDTIVNCLNRITDKNRSRIACISVSGQMHGVLLWNCDKQSELASDNLAASFNTRS